MIYDFCMYGGKHSAGAERCGAEESVLRFVEELPKIKTFAYTLIIGSRHFHFCIKLYLFGILATATFRSNRTGLCPLTNDKDLKSEGRGHFDYRVELNSFWRMVEWCGNRAILLGSTFSSVQSITTKQRWNIKRKEHYNVIYLVMVKEYNRGMGGVDLNDMSIFLYWVGIQTKKRWYLKIITHCLNISNVNEWLLYNRFPDQLDVPKKEQHSLLEFT